MQVIEANKIVGAVLLGLLVWRGTDFVAELVYGGTHGAEQEPAYVIVADAEPTQTAEVAAEDLPLASLLAEADPAAGEKQVAKCAACHTFEQGGPHRIGPNLWNALGRDIAGLGDFQYSEALASLEGEWTFETLDAFLEDPQGYVPGTAMVFPGIGKAGARADLLAYLRTLSEDPVAMPQPPQEAPEPATAAAEEEAPPEEPAVEEAEEPAAEPEPQEEVAAKEEAAEEAEPAAPAAANGLAARLAAASADDGESAASICSACHTFEQGGPNRVGPNLWDVVGEPIASVENFNYSQALKGLEGDWTYAELDVFLADPQGYAPGTRMVFPGVADDAERADVIAYLRAHSEDPPPLPGQAAAAPAEEEGETETAAAEAEPAEAETGAPEAEEPAAAEDEPAAEEEPAEAGDAPDGEAAADPADPADDGLGARLAEANADQGKSAARVCTACHTFEQGGPNRVGPNLWDVVGGPIASVENFNYSQALKGLEGDWTYAELDVFLADPQGYAPGTRMVFPGVADDAERADVIAYLRAQSEDPPPLPGQAAAAPAEEEGETEAAEAGAEPAEAETGAPEAEEPAAAEDEPAAEEEPAEAGEAPDGEAAAEPPEPADDGLGARLAEANADQGKSAARVCTACHTFEQGGPNRVGPNLWDVVGEPIARVENFNYSQALKGLEGDWTYAELDAYLADPQGYAPGTRMVFPGVTDDVKRADIIAYLRAQSEDPPPLPGQ